MKRDVSKFLGKDLEVVWLTIALLAVAFLCIIFGEGAQSIFIIISGAVTGAFSACLIFFLGQRSGWVDSTVKKIREWQNKEK